jgi:hypothetical protein
VKDRKSSLRPAPPPIEANEVAITTGGTILWLVAFVVLLPFHHTLSAHHATWWLWTCLCGAALGGYGIHYTRARRAALARRRAASDS